MHESSSSDLEELGINLKEFSIKRQVRLGSRKTQSSTKKDDADSELPPELQYFALLNNGVAILKKDLENSANNKVKLPLEVKKEGRKTLINITDVARILNRSVDHLVKYVASELVTNGSVKEDGNLYVKGNFIRSEVQEVLRRFIEHFVVCKICDSVEETDIVREKKLYFLKCLKCGGSRCVGNVIEGLTSKGKAKPKLRGML
ncbi:hypothetical protein P3W45_001395 [Vairimorpha bombi]